MFNIIKFVEMRQQIVPFHQAVFIVICIHNHRLLKRILFTDESTHNDRSEVSQ